MVKADVRRDYYADLGVSPGSDTDEIKKQFRKLALKYHPDRNPGRELEFNSKFQAIQAAHEILSDPQARLKYDTERLRAGYGKLYGPPSPNATRRTNNAAYPGATPGKAPTAKAQTSQRSSFQPPPSTGAQRYASYAKGAPQQPWEKVYEAQKRADAFRGFQDMNPNANMAGWSKFDPKTGKHTQQPGRSTPTSNPPGQSPRTKTAYEHFNTRPNHAAFGRSQSTRRKQGFAPGTPGGDEPMARNVSSYANAPRYDRSSAFFDSVPSPTSKKKTPSSSRPNTPQEDYVRPEFGRTSHRYATAGGERTYFSSAGLGRSTSMRDSSASPRGRSRTNPPSPTSPMSSRHHSASPKVKAQQNRDLSPSSTSSSDLDTETEPDEDIRPQTRPKATPRSRRRPASTFNFQSFESGEDSPGYTQAHSFRDPRHMRGHFEQDRPHSYHEFMDPDADGNYHKGHDSDSATFAFRAQQNPHATGDYGNADPSGAVRTGQDTQPNFFGPSPMNSPKSRSHDNLNNNFSASQWDGVFAKPDVFSPTPQNGHQRSRSRTSPMRGRSNKRTNTSSQSNVTSSSDESARQRPPPPMMPGSKFPADAWTQRFQNVAWTVPNREPGEQRRNSNGMKAPRKLPRPTRAPNVHISTEAEEDGATVPEPKEANPGLADEMEIDDEPMNPIGAPDIASIPPKTAPTVPAASAAAGGVATTGTNNLFNLNNLNNVAPFTSTNSGGIDDLQDIHATLPFESRPNDPNLKRHKFRSRALELPQPPKRPRRPAVIPANGDPRQMVLPQKAWDRYVAEMSAYIGEWNQFQRQVLKLFTTRQDAFETGVGPRWVSAAGDSTRLNVQGEDGVTNGVDASDDSDDNLIPGHPHGGFSAYLRSVEEHSKIREHWDVAWERHRICIQELGDLRGWIRNGGKMAAA